MNPIRLVAVLLIVADTLGLAYGGFSFVQATHRADIGPLHLQVNEERSVNVPMWLSIGAIVGGVVLLLTSRKS